MCERCMQRLQDEEDVRRLETINEDLGMSLQFVAPSDAAEVADFLTTGFWDDYGGPRQFAVGVGDTLTYDISGLTALGQTVAEAALETWSKLSGLNFTPVLFGPAQIVFDDSNAGAYAYSSSIGSTIVQSTVNVDNSWLNAFAPLESYGFQTYLHEIGHALGLGHAGDYNGSASFETGADFAADSWQMSIMSYFSQDENPNIIADFAYALTPMQADILAIRSLYGEADVREGDTVFGVNGSDGGAYNELFNFDTLTSLTLFDTGGTDTIDLRNLTSDQRIDLTPGAISDVGDLVGNLTIALETIIENVTLGAGDDRVAGNTTDNVLVLGDGADIAIGGDGDDLLVGDDVVPPDIIAIAWDDLGGDVFSFF